MNRVDETDKFMVRQKDRGVVVWNEQKEQTIMQTSPCPNFNHRRANAPVRFCPMCGGVVNKDIPISKCSEEEHAASRRNRNEYCVNCGEQLIKGI